MPKRDRKHKIVVIGGGTGSFIVLSALRNYGAELTAVVSMADDGGSTGILRDQYGVLPPGDIRRALVALASSPKILRDLFSYRFDAGDFGGHSFGNMLLAALEKITGRFDMAVSEAAKILNINGKVIPVTLDSIRLHARLADGKIIKGETNIDIPKSGSRAGIEKVWLKPAGRLNQRAQKAIAEADLIVIGPGDLYTSIIPNLLVSGMPEALKKSHAKKAYVVNLMTKFGETDGFKGEDFVAAVEKYVGRGVLDFAIFNAKKPTQSVIRRYRREKAEFVEPPAYDGKTAKPSYILADLIGGGPFVRHESRKKLARVLLSLLRRNNKRRKAPLSA